MNVEYGGLTERERMVAALIAQGNSNRAIAERLVVSKRTVTTHISNIFAKLGATNRRIDREREGSIARGGDRSRGCDLRRKNKCRDVGF